MVIRNYFKVAFRNIIRHKGYSFINISGLAVGMACCLLIFIWVRDELSFDRFHAKAGDIYRVIQNINFTDHSTTWAITQGPLGPSLKDDFPEIAEYMRFTRRGMRLQVGDRIFDEVLGMADGSILTMFSFPLLRGDPATALADPFSLLLSEKMAVKYFGNEDPLGQTIRADDTYDFRITGILAEVPSNSTLQFDFLIPFIFGRELKYTVDNWRNSQFSTYVLLQDGITGEAAVSKISRYLDEKDTIEKDAALNLQPLTRIHLFSNYEFDAPHGDIVYVRIFSIIGFFILLIACINFMNLTTARSANRAREVGMRKVSGAYRADIIKQFFGESILMAFLASILAFGLVFVLLPSFNALAAKELSLTAAGLRPLLLGFLGIVFITGVLSGSYPALFLSSFQPARVLKGNLSARARGGAFRRILVVFQFSLTILLMVSTLVVSRQIDFMRNKKLGYDRNHLITLGLRGDMREKFEAVKEDLLKNPDVLAVTSGSNVPTYGYTFSNSLWKWDGQNPDEELLMRAVFVDLDFFETLGMEILEGRAFSGEFSMDNVAFVINETAAAAMGMEDPVGKRLALSNTEGRIIGVVRDYHFTPLRQAIDPLIHIYAPPNCRILFVKLRGSNIERTLGSIEKTWKTFAPGFDFNYRFLDEALDALYRSEQRTGKIFRNFAVLAILISCLGLLGLASFMAEQRTKEIGIRKVLGASVASIVFLLSRQFARWVLLANVFAWPLAYFAMNTWLRGFAYRTSLGVEVFILSSVLALSVALITISFQAVKAAFSDPARSLRYE